MNGMSRGGTRLSVQEILRYSRHLKMPEFGPDAQGRLKASSVLVVGLGGLGCPAAAYLAAAGVGTLGIADCDDVEPDNLQRQILHWDRDVGRSKLDSAWEKLQGMNPLVKLRRHEGRLAGDEVRSLAEEYDVVVDGTDNFDARYEIAAACAEAEKPHVYGALLRFEGRVSVFRVPEGPCYACLHPAPPPPQLIPDCAEAGVFSPVAGIVGSILAAEALKLLAGKGETLQGRLLALDAFTMSVRILTVPKDPNCRICGRGRPSGKCGH